MGQVRCGESSGSQRQRLTLRFESFVEGLSNSFGVSLPCPRLEFSGDIKKFCSGLIEGQTDHPWRPCLHGLSSSSRMGIAHSLFLFRKLIPTEEPEVRPYVEKITSEQDPPDPGFLRFAARMTRSLFRPGWDVAYRDKCCTSTLPLSSCEENGRSKGGCRGLDAESRWQREDFCSYVLESVVKRRRGPSRVTTVLTEGKWRIVSIPPRVDNALRPLHTVMYDYLSRQTWCLRGDAKPSRFKSFSQVEGEVFVSGDYESATDNLNSEVQSTILAVILDQCRSVPPGIVDHAKSTFSSFLTSCCGAYGEQRRGQLMGQLLSFPLLCLVNYITFKYFVRRDVPVRINGDDIVFRSTQEECDRWRQGVKVSGLTLSAGKTMVDRRFLSLNSMVFRSSRRGVRSVPFVRPKAIWSLKERMCEKICSLKSRFNSFLVGFGSERARWFRRLFLVENRSAILRSRRSLTRGLGMKVGKQMLIDVGLWHRELFYLEHVEERPLPFATFSQVQTNDLPRDWRRVSPRWYPREVVRGWEFRFSHETVSLAWSNPVLLSDSAEERWMAECDAGCSPWGLSSWVNPRMRKLLRLSRKGLWRYVCLRRNESVFGRVRFDRGVGCVKPDVVACDSVDENSSAGLGVEQFHAVPPPLAY